MSKQRQRKKLRRGRKRVEVPSQPLISPQHKICAVEDFREDDFRYRSEVVDFVRCRACGQLISQRAKGRKRLYCGPRCRVAASRLGSDNG